MKLLLFAQKERLRNILASMDEAQQYFLRRNPMGLEYLNTSFTNVTAFLKQFNYISQEAEIKALHATLAVVMKGISPETQCKPEGGRRNMQFAQGVHLYNQATDIILGVYGEIDGKFKKVEEMITGILALALQLQLTDIDALKEMNDEVSIAPFWQLLNTNEQTKSHLAQAHLILSSFDIKLLVEKKILQIQ